MAELVEYTEGKLQRASDGKPIASTALSDMAGGTGTFEQPGVTTALGNIGPYQTLVTTVANAVRAFTGTLSAPIARFKLPTAPSTNFTFTLALTQDAAGSRLVTWPAAVSWAAGTAPTLTTTAGATDLLTFTTTDGGTTWVGRVLAANSLDARVVFDSFTRADSATVLGNAETGQAYTLTGTWGISGNKAYDPDGNSARHVAVADAGTADVQLDVDITYQAANPGIVLRYTDDNNFLLIELGTNIRLYKRVAGAYTQIGNVASTHTPGQTYHFTVNTSGALINIKRDGVQKLAVVDVTWSTITKHGIYDLAAATTNRFKNLKIAAYDEVTGFKDRLIAAAPQGELFTNTNGICEFDLHYVAGVYHLFTTDFQAAIRHRSAASIAALASAPEVQISTLRYPAAYFAAGTWHLWGFDNASSQVKHYTAADPHNGPWTLADTVSRASTSDPDVRLSPVDGKYYMAYKDQVALKIGVLQATALGGAWTDLGYIFSAVGAAASYASEEADPSLTFTADGRCFVTFSGWDAAVQRLHVAEVDPVTFKAAAQAVWFHEPTATWEKRNASNKVFNPIYFNEDGLGDRVFWSHNPSATGITTGWGYATMPASA